MKQISNKVTKPLHNKFNKDLFSRYESSNLGTDEESKEESDEEIEAFSSGGRKVDELDRYLNLKLDKSKLECNPLRF
ncbi:unnamed protein product [Rotaria sp. Silwood2]|nr:unnamed protein product [Rotaria sp. Silwood2]CAF2962714.1 unnamed protein product [Rotaria sp. Silwood2]CAF4054944.1 unnamed protein product [Rotaria sp. Silwood2]CAF4112359.1 unnamed protein product [Rotaria sp. Silwood2]CAF4306835.1 unnamed protein product [Rotaria sp. Silwood2]